MPFLRPPQPSIRRLTSTLRWTSSINPSLSCWRIARYQTRGRHSGPPPYQRKVNQPPNAFSSQENRSPIPQASEIGQETQEQINFAPNDGEHHQTNEEVLERVFGQIPRTINYLRPAIWAVAVSGGIYITLAYQEAKEEMKPPPPPQIRRFRPRDPVSPTEVASNYWNDLNPISKLSIGIIAANGAVHMSSFVAPRYWKRLWHAPIRNVSHTLFTSMFVHSGPLHLLFNMWACWNFLLPTGYSKLFEGNPYHTLSFFLSAGVLSGYAQHLSTIFSNPGKAMRAGRVPSAFIPSGGASGALFGVFGAFCMEYPDAGVGIIFIPISIAAQTFLPLVMTFDLVGMIRGYSGLSLGHAAHLSGALIGVAYSYFDGKNKIWKPLVNTFKSSMRKQRK